MEPSSAATSYSASQPLTGLAYCRSRHFARMIIQIQYRSCAADTLAWLETRQSGSPELGNSMTPTAYQSTILQWLAKAYPHACGMFESALRIIADETIPCRARMIAHAYREICNEIMDRYSSSARVDLPPVLDDLAKEFGRLELPATAAGPGATFSVENALGPINVPHGFIKAVERVVESHRAAPKARDRALAVFQGMQSSGAGRIPTDVVPTAERWFRMTRVFAEHVHDRKSDDLALLEKFRGEIEFLEATLISFASDAIDNLDNLDTILESANQ